MYFPKASNTRIQTNPPRPTQRKRDSAVIRRDTLKQRPLSQSSLFSVDGGHLLNKERQALVPFLVSAWPWKITCLLLKNCKVSLTPDIMYRVEPENGGSPRLASDHMFIPIHHIFETHQSSAVASLICAYGAVTEKRKDTKRKYGDEITESLCKGYTQHQL